MCFHTQVFLHLHNMFAAQNLLSSSFSLGVFKLIVKSLQGVKNEKWSWKMIYPQLLYFIFIVSLVLYSLWRVHLLYIMPCFNRLFFLFFLINQGLPGSTGLKGDRGDNGHPVRPLFLSKLLTSIVAHHALFVSFSHLFIFLLSQTGTTWDARPSRA